MERLARVWEARVWVEGQMLVCRVLREGSIKVFLAFEVMFLDKALLEVPVVRTASYSSCCSPGESGSNYLGYPSIQLCHRPGQKSTQLHADLRSKYLS
jgi:hypothetical protein